MLKQFFAFLFFITTIFIFSACGPVTPIPSATPTAIDTATATRQPTATAIPTETTPTPQPTVSVRLLEQQPPSQPVDKYELATWNPELPDEIMSIFYDNGYDLWPSEYDRLGDFYGASFSKEDWFRSLPMLNEKEKLCDLLNTDPSSEIIPGARPGQDVFSYVFEYLVNERGLKVDALNDFSDTSEEYSTNLFGPNQPYCLQPFMFSIGEYFDLNNSPLKAYNLFGDGKESYVYFVAKGFSDRRVAIYATHQVGGKVQLIRMRSWERFDTLSLSYDVKFFDIGDQDKDGYAEFVIDYVVSGSGYEMPRSHFLEWYEWDPHKKGFSTIQITLASRQNNPFVFWQEWEFGNQAKIPVMTVREYSYPYGSDSVMGNPSLKDKCKYLFSQQVYQLRGEVFQLTDETPSLIKNLPICQIVWAYRIVSKPQGWKNDQAIEVLSDALKSWPDEMNALWGESSRDYLQLRMAVWHDFRGEKQSAFELLDSLKGKKEQDLSSKLADVYLDERQQEGMVAACAALNSAKSQAVGDGIPSGLTPIWGYGDDDLVSTPPRIDDFCDRTDVIVASAATADIQNEEELRNWLFAIGKQNIYTKELSLKGRKIWLAGFLDRVFDQVVNQESQTVYVYHLWAFTPVENGLHALLVSSWRSCDEPANPDEADISFNALQPSPNTDLLGVFSKYELDVIRVYPDGRLSVQLTNLSRDSDFYFHDDRIDMLSKEYYPEEQLKLTTYVWNNTIQGFEVADKPSYDFSVAQLNAEHLLYQEKDYAGAIVFINRFLLDAPPEQVTPSFCYDDNETDVRFLKCSLPPDLYRPYLRYLLGTAYEMANQPEMAKLTYYALWNEYPTNLFGIAASKRLKLIQP